MTAPEIIREAFKRQGIRGDRNIANETGIKYETLNRVRMKNPGSLKLHELWLLQRVAYFTDEELLQIIKERGSA